MMGIWGMGYRWGVGAKDSFNFPLIGQAQGGNNVGLMRHDALSEYGDNSCYTWIWYIIGSSSFFVFFVCWEKSAPLQSLRGHRICSFVDHLPFKTSAYMADE